MAKLTDEQRNAVVAEAQIVTSVAAAARTWLINNAWIARHLLVMIAEKRRDVL
jgi:hypothetical protein